MKRLLIVVLCLSLFTACGNAKGIPEGAQVISENYTAQGHVTLYALDDKVYSYDYVAQESKYTYPYTNQKMALQLDSGSEEVTLGSDPFDVGALYPKAATDSPFAYSLTLDQSSAYIRSLLDNGCKVDSLYRCSDYIDYTLSYEDRHARVIVTTTVLRIFVIS